MGDILVQVYNELQLIYVHGRDNVKHMANVMNGLELALDALNSGEPKEETDEDIDPTS